MYIRIYVYKNTSPIYTLSITLTSTNNNNNNININQQPLYY